MRVSDFAAFITERERVRVAKERGTAKPWTDDIILQTFRFCNVRREDDAVTRWIAENWRTPHQDDPHVWFAMVVARLFNLPASLEVLGYPVPWKVSAMGRLTRFRDQGNKVFNAAYIVSTNGRAMDKIDYVVEHILRPMWLNRVMLKIHPTTTLENFHARLMHFNGMGSFMAAQVVADVKYTPALRGAQDWYSWAAPGPGSMRGLNRVLDKDPDAPWGKRWLPTLQQLRDAVLPTLPKTLRDLHAQDIQNCLCEFDKYQRIKLQQGRPKQLYPGAT